jgi:excisionase family DNA binding protein
VSAYLTVQEVAELMRCDHRVVRRAIQREELEAAMIGGRWLIREQAVDEWFDRRTRQSHVPAPRRAPKRHRSTRSDRPGSVARLQAIDQRSVTG